MKASDIQKITSQGTYQSTFRWNDLHSMLDLYELDMNPDFQRGHVWSTEQQAAFVEYALRGGDVQPIRMNNPSINGRGNPQPTVVVDGKQRLTAALAFIDDKLPIFGGYTYSQIDGIRLYMRGLYFRLFINDLKTRREVLTWYLELNTGGVIHTEEELNRVRNLLSVA